jgi:hypothetical protein
MGEDSVAIRIKRQTALELLNALVIALGIPQPYYDGKGKKKDGGGKKYNGAKKPDKLVSKPTGAKPTGTKPTGTKPTGGAKSKGKP